MIEFIQNRKYSYIFSGTLCGISLILLIIFGLKMGLDFTGGTLLEISFTQVPTLDQIQDVFSQVEKELKTPNESLPVGETPAESTSWLYHQAYADEPITSVETTPPVAEPTVDPTLLTNSSVAPEVTTAATLTNATTTTDTQAQPASSITEIGTPIIQSSGPNSFLIRIKYIDNTIHDKIIAGLNTLNNNQPVTELRYETIGPTISATLKKNALLAIALANIFIILYIAFAFRNIPREASPWKFGFTAVVALVHDVLITVGLFVVLGQLLNVEVDSLFVTALLTIMGFSVHDTIVVFDRIRENMLRNRYSGKSFAEVANESINQTMVRSINTSVTTIITLTALFLFGGDSIRYFSLALVFGIAIGTYSSIFVASPLLVDWRKPVARR